MQALKRLLDGLDGDAKARAEAYEDLVRRVAEGEDVSGLEASPILAAADKTGADLAAAVRRIERRRELARLTEAGDQAEADLAEVRELQAKADRELGAARQKHAEASARLQSRAAQGQDVVKRASDASRELVATAPAELRQKSDAMARERDQLGRRRGGLQTELRETEAKLADWKRRQEATVSLGRPVHAEEITAAEQARAKLIEDLEAVRLEESAAQEEAAAVREAMLRP
jgi:hypothetical protein